MNVGGWMRLRLETNQLDFDTDSVLDNFSTLRYRVF